MSLPWDLQRTRVTRSGALGDCDCTDSVRSIWIHDVMLWLGRDLGAPSADSGADLDRGSEVALEAFYTTHFTE